MFRFLYAVSQKALKIPTFYFFFTFFDPSKAVIFKKLNDFKREIYLAIPCVCYIRFAGGLILTLFVFIKNPCSNTAEMIYLPILFTRKPFKANICFIQSFYFAATIPQAKKFGVTAYATYTSFSYKIQKIRF